ncbi:hypothetical protein RND81_05G213500 [Saponaria officinalis]|uniref:Piriformospora indica-insensitive protein 2 n=1 Tax=Saponaria officinalis TaxID=3572 RepID=A0AAW1KUS5_SAPOF
MTSSSPSPFLLTTSFFFFFFITLTHQQQPSPTATTQPQPLNSAESNSVYLALYSLNPDTPWRTLYPDDGDLCFSPPHGVVCSYFNDTVSLTTHITELNFGYVSDASPNPACSPRATFPLSSLSSFPHLRKLFFYRCFTSSPVSLPALDRVVLGSVSEIEEIVFMENSALVGSIQGQFGNFTSLRRFILTGSNVSGGIPDEITKLPSVEQITISGNRNLGKGISVNVGNLKKLKILDLSGNNLEGSIPNSLGQNGNLIKLDLSYNNLSGEIPENLGNLQSLEFLDLGFNKFGNFGVPMFLGKLHKLKEVHLSGNLLGGVIPEIWENLGGILGIGLSGVGLIGNIPSSMGVYLRNVSYIMLDNNKLDGELPKEFELLDNLNEVNLRNNHLSGKIPFSVKFVAKVGRKLKVEGNSGICIDKSMRWSVDKIGSGLSGLNTCNSTTNDGISNSALFVSGGYLLQGHFGHLLCGLLCGWLVLFLVF